MQRFEIIVDKHLDGSVAYPLGLEGAAVGEGDTREEAVADATSTIKFHILDIRTASSRLSWVRGHILVKLAFHKTETVVDLRFSP